MTARTVFISYSHHAWPETCFRLRDRLRAAGFTVWIDDDEICQYGIRDYCADNMGMLSINFQQSVGCYVKRERPVQQIAISSAFLADFLCTRRFRQPPTGFKRQWPSNVEISNGIRCFSLCILVELCRPIIIRYDKTRTVWWRLTVPKASYNTECCELFEFHRQRLCLNKINELSNQRVAVLLQVPE